MKLNVTVASEGSGPPVILAHGLYGQGRNLGVIARQIKDRRVLLVDLRNHGDSPWSDQHDYPAMAADLAALIDDEGGKADLVGHSMGGKAAMATALLYPDKLGRLVAMDIAPVAYDHDQLVYINAMKGLDLTGLTIRSEADRRLSETLDAPMLRGFFLQSLDLRADPPRWKLNLDVLEASMPTLIGWPDDLPKASFTGPALFLYGADSDYATTGPAQTAIRSYFPQAELQSVSDAGHWLHAEKPQETVAAIAGFLDR